jgi:hypothetical protein
MGSARAASVSLALDERWRIEQIRRPDVTLFAPWLESASQTDYLLSKRGTNPAEWLKKQLTPPLVQERPAPVRGRFLSFVEQRIRMDPSLR